MPRWDCNRLAFGPSPISLSLTSRIHTTAHALIDFIFPPLCHVCRSFIPDAGKLHICPSCRDRIQPVPHPLCPICGIPFQGIGCDHVCGACLGTPPSFDTARAATIHDGHCRTLIHAFKYQNKTHLRRPLALLTIELLTDYIVSLHPDLIIPVPLHTQRLQSRGFNQAILLGEILSRSWHIPMERRVLRRIRRTEPQINLSAIERHTNVKNAFAVTNPTIVSGKRILLIDDVLTTGCTVNECAKTLKHAGAIEVTVITVARAIMG